MKRYAENMCRQRCEECTSYESTDADKGFCTEFCEEVKSNEGEFCEEFDQQ